MKGKKHQKAKTAHLTVSELKDLISVTRFQAEINQSLSGLYIRTEQGAYLATLDAVLPTRRCSIAL